MSASVALWPTRYVCRARWRSSSARPFFTAATAPSSFCAPRRPALVHSQSRRARDGWSGGPQMMEQGGHGRKQQARRCSASCLLHVHAARRHPRPHAAQRAAAAGLPHTAARRTKQGAQIRTAPGVRAAELVRTDAPSAALTAFTLRRARAAPSCRRASAPGWAGSRTAAARPAPWW